MADDEWGEAEPTAESSEYELAAPIVAVTVYPDRARVTRRGRLRLPPGDQRVVLDGLPLALQAESVRVAGTGPATVLGVDIARRHRPRAADEATRRLEAELQAARTLLAALDDEDAVAGERLEFYRGLARRATRTHAVALAAGQTDPGRVAEFADAVAARQSGVLTERRALTERRSLAQDQIRAYERGLEARRRQREPDDLAALVGLLVEREAEVELEVSYVVDGAGWHSAYDLRLTDAALTLSWYGLVTQRTGEDWPECDLRLSTARPSGAARVPELDPWFVDRYRPIPMSPPAVPKSEVYALRGAGMVAGAAMPQEYGSFDTPLRAVADQVSTVEQGATAATYTPARPVAVPADGGAHRATVAVVELSATLDYVTAPVRAAEAQLRATVVNTSAHTLPAGTAAVFHSGDFVGNTALTTWAPGEELELALGIDDRIRIERELVRRGAAKAALGSTRRREAEHRITITNHTPRPVAVTVLDQLPVSRDEGIVVKELRLEPAPAERTDMGVLTWRLRLDPGEEKKILLGVRVELGRGVEIVGWRE